jgi:iron complex outermembrane receptor protein
MRIARSPLLSRGATKSAALLGAASLITLASTIVAHAQTEAENTVPEQVLVTGSLIRGTAVVGVPVIEETDLNFKENGALTIADVLRSIPSVTVQGSLVVTNSGANTEGNQAVSIHNLNGTAPRTLLMIDGMRYPIQGHGSCEVDPSIIPELALDRVDVLADGASATYGSDAIAGVINVILKRGYDGAISQARVGASTDIGGVSEQGSQLYGRTWGGGDITLTYEFYQSASVSGTARPYVTYNFAQAQGLDNRTPITAARPGIISLGAPAAPPGTPASFNATMGTTCANCYAIPAGQNGTGLTWAAVLANNPSVISFAKNEINPYVDSWLFPYGQRNAAVATFDQNIIPGVQFFASGFYNNHRVVQHSAGTTGATDTNAFTVAIPTTNPFYPAGAPAGLRISYDIDRELQGRYTGGSVGGRWEAGFNFDLPFAWKDKLSYSTTEDNEFSIFTNMVNQNMVVAALGNTVAAVPANGSTPPQGSFTKPANIPYLNLFCDSTAFQCNSAATLNYIMAYRNLTERTIINEVNTIFDGPLFDLPGGTVRAAVGGDYTNTSYRFLNEENDGSPNTSLLSQQPDAGRLSVWAIFAQINLPLVSETNAIPFVKSLNLELSGRFDDYSLFGSTKNPKISFNWDVAYGLTLIGSWGTSFRAPAFSESSTVAGVTINAVNILGGANQDNAPTCRAASVAAGMPPAASAAAALNPTCSTTEGLLYPGGIAVGGGAGGAAGIRPSGFKLSPELATNISGGFRFAPMDFLKGLDLQADYYRVKINNVLASFPSGTGFDDPVAAPLYILPTDPNFTTYVQNIIHSPLAPANIVASNIKWISDGAVRNVGWLLRAGVDFNSRYDWDMGDFGFGNLGVSGNYTLTSMAQSAPGATIVDAYHGLNSGGHWNYRARLGWTEAADGSWSVTGFMNYHAHIGDTGTEPPACFLIGHTACNASGLPEFAQYTQQYPRLTNYQPAFITFDLSIGYKTGERPANDYLKDLGIQLTINDIMDRAPQFQYIISTRGGSPQAFNRSYDPMQRVVTLVVTKVW